MDTATRTCCTCTEPKPLNDTNFAADTRPYQGGFTYECRPCAAARMATWRREHPKGAAASTARRRAREKAATGEFTANDLQQLLDGSGHACQSCGGTEALVADHVIPTVDPRCTNGPENRQILCSPCNLKKGVKIIDYRPAALLVAA